MTAAESLLLTTRQRYAITLGLVVALLVPALGLMYVGALLGGPLLLRSIAISATVIVLSSASMPLLSDVAQRAVMRGPLVRLLLHLGLAVTHVLALLITQLAVQFMVIGQALEPWMLGPTLLAATQSGFLCYAATAGVVRAIQWYRSSSLAEAERRSLQSIELEKARDLVEETLRPQMVGETLRRIRDLLPHGRREAERTVTRLARHGRMVTAILAGGGATAVARLRTLRSVLLMHGTDVELTIDLDSSRNVPASLRAFAAAVEESARRLWVKSVKIAARTAPGGGIHIGLAVTGDDAEAFVAELALAQVIPSVVEGPGREGVSCGIAPRPPRSLDYARDDNGWSAGRAGEDSAEVELLLPDDRPAEPHAGVTRIPMVRESGSVYTWVVVLAAGSVAVSLYATTLQPAVLSSWSYVASALIWLAAALPLIHLSKRIVTLRWGLAVTALFATAWLAGIAVSFAAITVADAYASAMSLPLRPFAPMSFLPVVARHNVLIACAIAAVSFAFANGRKLLGAQASLERMRQALASAELRNLEARIQPHFLFNALVSLLSLIRLEPGRAARMCDLLHDLLARSVAASGVHEWPLREEMALTSDYLAIQHIRFGERLAVQISVDPDSYERLIPRLLLQPLVENAVKHGVARREETTHLAIAVATRNGALHLTVVNDAEPAEGPPAAGGGLTFVQSRVAAAGGTVEYDAGRPGQFRVRCVLPLEHDRPS